MLQKLKNRESKIDDLLKKVRQAKLYVDVDRAVLVTESYQQTEGEPAIIRQAKSFRHVLENMPIRIEEDELIVGAQCAVPLGILLYPEYASQLLSGSLDKISTRPWEPIKIKEDAKKILKKKVFPYWEGRSLHETFWNRLSPSLREILFVDTTSYPPKDHEIQSLGAISTQGIGHIVFDPKLFCGYLTIKEQVVEKLNKTTDKQSKQFYEAALISIDAVIAWSKRYSELAYKLAGDTDDSDEKDRLLKLAKICDRVPSYPPETFHEALQFFWFAWIAAYIAEDGIGYSTGPIDEYLYPYYEKDIEKGVLTEDESEFLIQHLFVKFAKLTYGLKSDDAAKYHTGLKSFHFEIGRPYKEGRQAVNKLTDIFIDTMIKLKLNNPSLRVHLGRKSPEAFFKKVVNLINSGTGHPSIFNADVEVDYWLNHGIAEDEARNCTFCACVTPTLYGDSGYNYMGYWNAAALLNMCFNNGVWKYSGKQVGLQTGDPENFESLDEFLDAFRRQARHTISSSMLAFNFLMQCYAELFPSPYTSLFVDGCIENGRDKTWGGARHNFAPHPVCVGVPDAVNSLAAIKKFIFDEKKLSWNDLRTAIDKDFDAQEPLRQMLLNKAPKWGNDDDYVDDIAKEVIGILREEYGKVSQVSYIGKCGSRDIAFASLGANVPFGKATGSLPWGKRAEDPVSDALSPNHGTDKCGPTAVLNSISKVDWANTGFALLNVMFTPSAAESGAMVNFLKAFVELGVPHVQFNVFNREVLRDAQKHPEEYKSLLVRVSGYCAFFVELSMELQEDIIERTLHESI